MIEYVKLLITVVSGSFALVLAMIMLAVVLTTISDLGEKYAWVYPVVGVLTIVLIVTTLLYITGTRAPW